MTTEITTEVSYQIQYYDDLKGRWRKAMSPVTDKGIADKALLQQRAIHTTYAIRMLHITTTTEVIA